MIVAELSKDSGTRKSFLLYLLLGFCVLAAIGFALRVTFVIAAYSNFEDLPISRLMYALIWGGRFDLAVAAFLMSLVALFDYALIRFGRYRCMYAYPFAIMVFLMVLMQVGDTVYFLESGRHVSYEIKDLLLEIHGLTHTLATRYQPAIVGVAVAAFVLYLLARNRRFWLKYDWPRIELSLLVWLLIAIPTVRGGFTDTPMKPARRYAIGDERLADIAHNAAYAIIHYLMDGEKIRPLYQELPHIVGDEYQQILANEFMVVDKTFVAPVKRANIILVALESWPAHLMASFKKGTPPVTPEFNRLRYLGLTTDGIIAEGHRTVEGLFSLLCSYPNPLGSAVINNQLFLYEYMCLPEILHNAGWSTALFQGMNPGKTGALAQKLGVRDSYGKRDIKSISREANGWGVDDNDLYDFIVSKATQENSPFFYVINTTTTHDLILPLGEPYLFGMDDNRSLRKSVLHYADEALGRFIRELRKTLTAPTLIVLTSDHAAGDLPTRFSHYFLPFTMFALNDALKVTHIPGLASQRDIAPTVLEWLGGYAPWFTGQSLLSLDVERLQAGYFSSGTFGWVKGTQLVEFNGTEPSRMTCYRWRSDLSAREKTNCNSEDLGMVVKARVFTQYSQSLLFSGKTQLYGSRVRDGSDG